MRCDPDGSWEELEPALVISTTVVDLHDVSINRGSGQSARYDASEIGSDCSAHPLYRELSTPTRAEGKIPVAERSCERMHSNRFLSMRKSCANWCESRRGHGK